jgi:hypothetical protein
MALGPIQPLPGSFSAVWIFVGTIQCPAFRNLMYLTKYSHFCAEPKPEIVRWWLNDCMIPSQLLTLRLLAVVIPLWIPRFSSRAVNFIFVTNKVGLDLVFSEQTRFSVQLLFTKFIKESYNNPTRGQISKAQPHSIPKTEDTCNFLKVLYILLFFIIDRKWDSGSVLVDSFAHHFMSTANIF